MANEFKVKNGIKFPDGTVQTTASAGGSGGSYLPLAGGTMAGAITFDVSQTWPTFNQDTTGTAANVTGTVAIANGGTGAATAAAALTNLGAQPTLVSGTNIKTINGTSLLGSGDIAIAGGGSSVTTISDKTANYTVVAGDLASIINITEYTGSLTVTLSSAATLGAGFYCWVWFNPTNATSNGYITITPSASQTIDSKDTLILRGGEGLLVISNGSNWEIGAKRTMKAYSENFSKGNTVVASGLSSIAMGQSVTSSGTGSFCAGGTTNTASGAGSAVIGGYYNFAQAQYSIITGGSNNTITSAGDYSNILGGYSNNISGKYSIAAGYGASVSQDGKWAYSSASIAANGDAQTGIMVLRASTIDATATILKSSASAADTSNQVILPNNSAFAFSGLIVARQKTSDGTNSAAWRVEGLLLRGATAATTSLVNSATTVISNVPGWTLTLTADTTNGGLAVTATGAAGTNIYWVATIQTSEVTYA